MNEGAQIRLLDRVRRFTGVTGFILVLAGVACGLATFAILTGTTPITPTAEQLVDMIGRDKKVAHGMMHFAVLRDEGDLVIEPRALNAELVAQVREVLVEDRVFARR